MGRWLTLNISAVTTYIESLYPGCEFSVSKWESDPGANFVYVDFWPGYGFHLLRARVDLVDGSIAIESANAPISQLDAAGGTQTVPAPVPTGGA